MQRLWSRGGCSKLGLHSLWEVSGAGLATRQLSCAGGLVLATGAVRAILP